MRMKVKSFVSYVVLLCAGVLFTLVLRSKPANSPSNNVHQLDSVREITLPTHLLRPTENDDTESSKRAPSSLPPLTRVPQSPDDPRTSDWSEVQARRTEHLREVCSAHPEYRTNLTDVISNDRKRLWSFIFNDDLKVIYGSLCKVQSTSWKKIFMVLDGKAERVEDIDMKKWSPLNANLHYLSKLDEVAEVEYRLREYTRYLIVREPFSRALSGYRNKLAKRNQWFEKLVGRKIIAKFRRKPSRSALLTGRGVTFTEFLKHIAYLPDNELDGHWRPMYRLVYPCDVSYDFIGKQETTDIDVKNILDRIHLGEFISSFPKGNDNMSDAADIFNSYYRGIDANLLREVYWKFLPDIQLFGYELPDLIREKFEGIGFDYRTAHSNLTYFH